MDNRSIDLFDVPQHNAKYGTSHVHAYIRGSNGWYTVYVTRYTPDAGDPGIRRYPLSATEAAHVEVMTRFSAKRLGALATDPIIVNKARTLAGME